MRFFKLAAIAATLAFTVTATPFPNDTQSDPSCDIGERQPSPAGIRLCYGMKEWIIH